MYVSNASKYNRYILEDKKIDWYTVKPMT